MATAKYSQRYTTPIVGTEHVSIEIGFEVPCGDTEEDLSNALDNLKELVNNKMAEEAKNLDSYRKQRKS